MKKRTAAITLAILGALSAGGCANPEPTSSATYTNIAECVADGFNETVCSKSLGEAKKVTEANAPKFASAEQCAAQFSNCEKSSSGAWFMPAVMGYMVGSMMNGGSRAPATPIYYDRERRPQAASFAGGAYRPTPAAETYTARSQARAAAASRSASTSSRGGFGGRSGSSGG